MKLFGLTIARTKALTSQQQALLTNVDAFNAGWFPLVREPFSGAWQRNQEMSIESVLQHPTVYACVTLIAKDIAKTRALLRELGDDGVWRETENPAYSPVLRKPNSYQTPLEFFYWWILSKLVRGNTYVLKARDLRSVVQAMYILDPARVRPLVSPDGSIFYSLQPDPLKQIGEDEIVVPASEIIHDRMDPLYHELMGISPLYAAWVAAFHGMNIARTESLFYQNGAKPNAVIEVPGDLKPEQAARMKTKWNTEYGGENQGKIAFLSGGMKYVPVPPVNARDSQIIEQLNWTDERICAAFHIPKGKIIGEAPANVAAMNQEYLTSCLSELFTGLQQALIVGLELRSGLDVKFDLNDLFKMDAETKLKAASDGVRGGYLAPNEARRIYFDLPPVDGGDTPYMQIQDYSLAALDRRDSQQSPITPGQQAAAPQAQSVQRLLELLSVKQLPESAKEPEPSRADLLAAVLQRVQSDAA